MFQYADYIYAVYEEKSFTKAAKKLYISQPALSAAIKRAEEKLGFLIFDRTSHSLALTDSGHVYIAAVENMRKVKDELTNYVENVRSLNYGDVVVGAPTHLVRYWLPAVFYEFHRLHPGIRLFAREGDLGVLGDEVLAEKGDIIIDSDIQNEALVTAPLLRERILLAVPDGHTLHETLPRGWLAEDIRCGRHLNEQTPPFDRSLLRGESLILVENDNFSARCRRLCEERDLTFNNTIFANQMETAAVFAKVGMGVTLVTDTFVRFSAESAGMTFYDWGTPLAEQTLFVAYKKSGYLSPAVEAFVEFLQKQI